jgi:hypothetical protein
MNAEIFSGIGALLNVVGVLGLFRFGIPRRNRSDGRTFLAISGCSAISFQTVSP